MHCMVGRVEELHGAMLVEALVVRDVSWGFEATEVETPSSWGCPEPAVM